MKLKKFTAILLCALLLVSMLPMTVSAAGSYYNADYLESSAAAAYSETDLGAAWSPNGTTWKVWAPTADHVQLRLYATGSDEEAGAAVLGTCSMEQNALTGVWSLTLSGDHQGQYYTYLVTVRGVTRETRDIYAKAAGVNGKRSMVVDLDATDPTGWAQDSHVLPDESTDAVIWEVHVRDFSISPTSGVSPENRGKYLAFTEDDTTVSADADRPSTCVSYLKEMGVNTVHLLPVYDFGSVDETVEQSWIETSMEEALSEGSSPSYYRPERNWGYDPVNYNVPEGSYSSDPYDGATRITEFKQMVQALHEAGISVVMDVVYNHTYDLDDFKWGRVLHNNAFNDTVPGYYFRMNGPLGWINGSGCGNVTASDKLMYRKYMVESVRYWATEYHIDGFRFDLMACHDVDTMNLIRAGLDSLDNGEGEKILMYGEPWDGSFGGGTGISDGTTPDNAGCYGLSERIAMFCPWMRDAIKGSPDDASSGWVQGETSGSQRDAVFGGLSANDGRLTARSQTVTYADAHDNLILWDKLLKSNGSSDWQNYSGATAETCLKQLNLAKTIVLMSQGMAFNVGGTEFARTKLGCHNSYKAGDNINAIDWTARETNAVSADYYKGLIQIRKAFSPITDPQNEYTKNELTGSGPNLIAIQIPNQTAGEWSSLVLILNSGSAAGTVTLPAGSWTLISDGVHAGLDPLGTCSGTYTVPACCSAILVQGSYTGTQSAPKQAAAPTPMRDGTDYYLFGYINGANYACEEDYQNLGDYHFVNGQVTATFAQDSYVAVKTGDNANWYMTDGWLGTETTSATLYNTNTPGLQANKLYVPGSVEVTFTLTENGDGTLTLSYTTAGGPEPPTPITHTAEDKVILHCWNWSYDTIRQQLPAIKAAGYTAVQTSPAQPHSGYRDGVIGTGDWWMLYQPLGLHIAQSNQSWLGGVNELTQLCTAAHEQGIEVIVDVVSNHICNCYNDIAAQGIDPKSEGQIIATEGDRHGYEYEIHPASEVENFNPELYNDQYYRPYIFCSDENTQATVRGNIGMPDFRTEDPVVQAAVLTYLEELIDAGVDGFRFDAAKHIETPSDGDYASDFWPNVIGGARDYAQNAGKDIWAYGEVLSTAGKTRKMNYYAPYIDMTEISYAYTITEGFGDHKGASTIANQLFKDWLGVGVETLAASDLVLMAESHDMYAEKHGSFSRYGSDVINKAWAVASARADASALYFARPDNYEIGINENEPTAGYPTGTLGACEDFHWKDLEVAEANKFHNAFVGASENVLASGSYVVVERYNQSDYGAVIVNADGTLASVSALLPNAADGTYYDQITGSAFTVSNHTVTGEMGATGIVILRTTQPVQCDHPADQRYTVETEPTCTEAGGVVEYCSVCGRQVQVLSTIPALGHADNNGDGRCDLCGLYLGTVDVYFVDALDWVNEKDHFTNVNYYAWGTGGETGAWPGAPAALVGRTTDEHGIWKVSLNPDLYQTVKFVGRPGETGTDPEVKTVNLPFVTDAENASGGYVIYTPDGGVDSTGLGDEYTCGLTSELEPICAHTAYTWVSENGTVMKVCDCCGKIVEAEGPIETENLQLYSSVLYGVENTVVFSIRTAQLEPFSSFCLKVDELDNEGNVLDTKLFEPEEFSEGYLRKARYEGISARKMGVTYRAVILATDADGQTWCSNTLQSSLKDYIANELVKSSNKPVTKTLCADMLNYGAAAQMYSGFDTEHPVNENLSEQAAAAKAKYETKTQAPATKVNSKNGPTLYASIMLENRINISLTARGITTTQPVKIQMQDNSDGSVVALLETTPLNALYRASYDSFTPDMMRQEFRIAVLVDGVETGTPIVWSIEGCVRDARLSTNGSVSPELLALYNALLIYGDSVAAARAN